jgi:hypothetical protein
MLEMGNNKVAVLCGTMSRAHSLSRCLCLMPYLLLLLHCDVAKYGTGVTLPQFPVPLHPVVFPSLLPLDPFMHRRSFASHLFYFLLLFFSFLSSLSYLSFPVPIGSGQKDCVRQHCIIEHVLSITFGAALRGGRARVL